MHDQIEFHQGDRLRKARESTGMSAQAFAKLVGISRDTLRGYEAGDVMPRPPVLRSWADATGYTVAALVGSSGPGGGEVVDLRARREQASTTST